MASLKKTAVLSATMAAVSAGALLGAAGSASAAPAHYGWGHDRDHCQQDRGPWTGDRHDWGQDRGSWGEHRGSWVWVPGHWDHGHFERGHWARVWYPGDRDCDR